MTGTYYGATAATTLANPPLELMAAIGGQVQYPGLLTTRALGAKLWFYSSTGTAADLAAAGYFSDGGKLGMTPGDIMLAVYNGGAPVGAAAHSTNMRMHMGMLTSTESSLTTAAYNLSTNYST